MMQFLKNKKFLLYMAIILLLIIILSLAEAYIKNNYKEKKVVGIDKVPTTTQKALGYNYYTVKNWENVFTLHNEKQYETLYSIKDYVEEYIQNNFEEKRWEIKEVTVNDEDFVVFYVLSENGEKKIEVVISQQMDVIIKNQGKEENKKF